ncbi:hypothetical protein M3J09_003735 [Ascochyta lentis]
MQRTNVSKENPPNPNQGFLTQRLIVPNPPCATQHPYSRHIAKGAPSTSSSNKPMMVRRVRRSCCKNMTVVGLVRVECRSERLLRPEAV